MVNFEQFLRSIWPTKKYYLQSIRLGEEVTELNHKIETLKQLACEFKNNKNIIKAENKTLLDKYDNLSKTLHDLQMELEKKEYRIQQLESQLGVLEANEPLISSNTFWEDHYKNGGNSGTGSYSKLAEFKAKIVNDIVYDNDIQTVIELGCGDGNQLLYMHYPSYVGVDVSETIIKKNLLYFTKDETKKFYVSEYREMYMNQKYDLSISMDVIYHLLEDNVYLDYMNDLFSLSNKFVVIYSSNHEEYTKWPEYRHRNFMRYIQEKQSKEWTLLKFIPNQYPYLIGYEATTSASDFYIFKRG